MKCNYLLAPARWKVVSAFMLLLSSAIVIARTKAEEAAPTAAASPPYGTPPGGDKISTEEHHYRTPGGREIWTRVKKLTAKDLKDYDDSFGDLKSSDDVAKVEASAILWRVQLASP